MKCLKAPLLCFLLGFLFQTSLCAQISRSRFANWLIKDPMSGMRNIGSEQILAVGITTFNLSVLSGIDERNSHHFQRELYSSKYLGFADEFGSFKIVAPASGALFGLTLLTSNRKLQDAAFTSFQSVLNTAITVNIAKFTFARSRPYEMDGAHDFDFLHRGATSFPSGHASTAFALITPWVVYYPSIATYALLSIPVGTSIARIAKGKHWLTDVSAGALIGGHWGYHLARRHLNQTENSIHVTPFIQQSGGGFSVNIPFN